MEGIVVNGCKRIFILLLLSVVATSAVVAGPISAPEPLEKIIAEGLSKNNEIQSLESKLAALKNRVDVAGSLDDPRIGIGVLNLPTNSFRFDQEPMTQKQLFVAQKFPWFGRLDLASQQAVLKAERQAVLIRGKKLELARKLTDAYYELSYLDDALKTNARLAELVDQALEAAQTQYATGRGLQQDIFQAQVELSKLQDEALMLSNRRRNQEDLLNALINRERFVPVVTGEAPDIPPAQLSGDALRQQVLAGNPSLQIKAIEMDAARLNLDLAQKDYWPDMDVRLAYGQRDENAAGQDWSDFVSASVTMNVPLWQHSRQDQKVAASRSEKQSARQAYDALRLSLPHRADALLSDIKKERDSYLLFSEQLIDQTRDWAHSATAAYEVGKVEFDTMINARMRVLRFELKASKYRYGILQKRAELEELVGGPIAAGDE
jgi:cobalt-zinc-cadmium efflux system outer membrane protein